MRFCPFACIEWDFQKKKKLHSYSLYNESRKVTSKIRLSDFYLRSDIVQNKDNYDSFTRGLLTQNSQEQDEFFTEEVYTIINRRYRFK